MLPFAKMGTRVGRVDEKVKRNCFLAMLILRCPLDNKVEMSAWQ